MSVIFLLAVATRPSAAQSHLDAVPYDSIATDGENYAGPARQSTWDNSGPILYIGLLAPLQGPQSSEGEALVAAAKMALEDSTQHSLLSGQRIDLAIGDESGPAWGHVSDVILNLVLQQNVVALITSTDGTDTHLSEQVGNRIGVPILTLSNDATTTQIDIPWIFRLGPSDTSQAQTIAANIYREHAMKKVMVISGKDHDGRDGLAAMRQVTRSMGVPLPDEAALDPLHPDFSSIVAGIQADSPQAMVLWTRADAARRLLSLLRTAGISIPIYISQQAAQVGSGLSWLPPTKKRGGAPVSSDTWSVIGSGSETAVRGSFATRYFQRTGRSPSAAASEAYDAVCLTVRALRATGPNRARVRDQLARTREFPGASGTITFDRQGNNTTQIHLVALRLQQTSTKIGGSAE